MQHGEVTTGEGTVEVEKFIVLIEDYSGENHCLCLNAYNDTIGDLLKKFYSCEIKLVVRGRLIENQALEVHEYFDSSLVILEDTDGLEEEDEEYMFTARKLEKLFTTLRSAE